MGKKVPHDKECLSLFKQRLKDQYLQCWFSCISLSSKLCLYADFKLSYDYESYLYIVNFRKFRRAIASFRTSSHKLEVEMGRYINIPRNKRKCKFCRSVIEDEYHFLMSCQLYQDLRKTFLPTEYTHVVNLHNFIKLMSTRDELTL